jgi:hypothetical protein
VVEKLAGAASLPSLPVLFNVLIEESLELIVSQNAFSPEVDISLQCLLGIRD